MNKITAATIVFCLIVSTLSWWQTMELKIQLDESNYKQELLILYMMEHIGKPALDPSNYIREQDMLKMEQIIRFLKTA